MSSLTFVYTNHAGVVAVRRVYPAAPIYWGATKWHPEPQWLLDAHDCDRDGALRTFAVRDMRFAPAQRGLAEHIVGRLLGEELDPSSNGPACIEVVHEVLTGEDVPAAPPGAIAALRRLNDMVMAEGRGEPSGLDDDMWPPPWLAKWLGPDLPSPCRDLAADLTPVLDEIADLFVEVRTDGPSRSGADLVARARAILAKAVAQ